ncbi:hypothetical protein PC116_g24256 [Phytophthora cactorum]|nr:hypothetical protein PC116_g24256 [Phytophthora cactorum]
MRRMSGKGTAVQRQASYNTAEILVANAFIPKVHVLNSAEEPAAAKQMLTMEGQPVEPPDANEATPLRIEWVP